MPTDALTPLAGEALSNPYLIQAETAPIWSGGGSIDYFYVLNSAGYVGDYVQFSGAGSYVFTVRASGAAAGGVAPIMTLVYDGLTQQQVSVTATTFTDYAFSLNATTGVHEVKFGFINDGRVNNQDRNLFIDWIKIQAPNNVATPAKSSASAWGAELRARETATLAQTSANIDVLRKTDAALYVVDRFGVAIPNAQVTITQTSHDFKFGANLFGAARQGTPELNDLYASRFTKLFNYGTAPFYWSSLEPIQGSPDYVYTDTVVNWAIANGVTLKGHPVFWKYASSNPSWINGTPTPAQQQAHLTELMQRYAGKVEYWDVLNEPSRSPGYDIKQLHQWARQVDPAGKLLINDYGEFVDGAPGLFAFIQQAIGAGAAIDGIALQGHSPVTERFSMSQVWQVLNRYATFGLPISLSELTPTSNGQTMTGVGWSGVWNEAAQADYAVKLFRTAFAHPMVDSISWWDLADDDAYYPGGGLLHSDLTPKPVYTALDNLINTEWTTTVSATTASQGRIDFRGFYGDYHVTINVNGRIFERDRRLTQGGSDSVWIESLEIDVPIANVQIPNTIVRAASASFTLTSQWGTPASGTGNMTYYVDWTGDGVIDQTVIGPSGTNVSHIFTSAGTNSITVWAKDSRGVVSDPVTASFEVKPWGLLPSARWPGLTDLVVGGTDGVDAFYFVPNGAGIQILQFVVNSVFATNSVTFTGVTGDIVAYGRGMTDLLLSAVPNRSAVFYGQGGDDVLVGSFGNDLLDGGDGNDLLMGYGGNDTLLGGAGADLLFGGSGADRLEGSAGSDLLIAGLTAYDQVSEALYAIQREWVSSRTYNQKIANLMGTGTGPRNNGSTFLTPNFTLTDDNAIDTLFGQADQDWFIYEITQDIGSDVSGETVTDI